MANPVVFSFYSALSRPTSIEQPQQQQQQVVNETPVPKKKIKTEVKSKIAIFDGLFSCPSWLGGIGRGAWQLLCIGVETI